MESLTEGPNPIDGTAPDLMPALRRQAEDTLTAREALAPHTLGPEETERLVHELRVHQIELEMQNEELRRAHEELEVSRARFVHLYDFAPVGYVTVSESGLILEANLTASTLLGMVRSKLVRKPLTRFILTEDQDIYYRHRMALLDTGESQTCELRLLHTDGQPFWARLEATTARDGENGLLVSRIVLSDINEFVQAKEAQREGEERFRAAFEHGTIGMTITSLDGRFLKVNAALCKMLGYTEPELEARTFNEIIHPDDLDANRIGIQQIITGKTLACRMEKRYFHKNGHQVWADMSMVAVRDAEGNPCFLVAHVVDITKRKLAENALAVSETRYRRLFETAQDGILLLDARTGRIIDVNPFLLEMLGYSSQEMVGRRLWEIGAFTDVEASRRAFKELQTARYIRYEDLPLQTAAGAHIEVEFVSNVYPVDGKQIIQCNIRDITQRRQVEQTMQHLNAEMHTVLEARVRERTAELAEVLKALRLETLERLRAEEKERAAVVEERTRMAREIHDTLAQGFTGIIIQLEVAEDVLLEDVEVARAHMRQACTLARSSLVEARRSVWALRPRLLEGGNLVVAFAEMIEQFPHDASVMLEFSQDGIPRPLLSDLEHDLLRIGQEALHNAVKYAGARRIHIVLSFDDRQVTLRIADDGCGFDALERRPRGFGLRIMAERAERHAGQFILVSQPGHGTCIEALVPSPTDVERGTTHA